MEKKVWQYYIRVRAILEEVEPMSDILRVCVCVLRKKIKKIELCENKIATPLYAPGRCDVPGVVRSVA